jgi:hypothetical protein
VLIHVRFKKAIQLEPLPQLQAQPAGAELPCTLQAHFVQHYARNLRVICRRLDL